MELLNKLVSFDTRSENSNLQMAEFLADYLVSRGFRVEFVRSEKDDKTNLLAELGPYAGGLALCGHMDTLPPGEGWTKPPFELTCEDGKLYGRGTTDMKCFIAQAVKAAEEFAETDLKKRLQLLFTYEEEVGCGGSRRLAKFWEEQGAPKPDFTLVGEPTSFRVCRMHKGYSGLRLIFKGISCHSSRPDRGVSAIMHASRACVELEKLQEQLKNVKHDTAGFYPEFPYTSMGIGTIEGGEAANQVPARCELSLEYRSMPGEGAHELYDVLRTLVRETLEPAMKEEARLKKFDESLVGIEVVPRSFAEPMLTTADTELERLLLELSPVKQTGATYYYTDGGIFGAHGVPSLICGPGSIDQAHKPDEFITKEQHSAGTPFLKKVIERFCA